MQTPTHAKERRLQREGAGARVGGLRGRACALTVCGARHDAVGHLFTLLLGEQRLQPGVWLVLALEDDAEAVVFGVERNDVLVMLDVMPLVDVEAGLDGNAALGQLPVVELLLRVVVLEARRRLAGLGRAQHKILPLGGLQLLEVAGLDHRAAPPRDVRLGALHWHDPRQPLDDVAAFETNVGAGGRADGVRRRLLSGRGKSTKGRAALLRRSARLPKSVRTHQRDRKRWNTPTITRLRRTNYLLSLRCQWLQRTAHTSMFTRNNNNNNTG